MKLSAELVEDLVEEGQRPTTFEESFRGPGMRRLGQVAALGVAKIDRDRAPTASTLLSVLPIMLIRQEMLASGQKESPKSTLRGVDRSECLFFE